MNCSAVRKLTMIQKPCWQCTDGLVTSMHVVCGHAAVVAEKYLDCMMLLQAHGPRHMAKQLAATKQGKALQDWPLLRSPELLGLITRKLRA